MNCAMGSEGVRVLSFFLFRDLGFLRDGNSLKVVPIQEFGRIIINYTVLDTVMLCLT